MSNDVTMTSGSHSELSNDQVADTTLATCWKMAKVGKGGFVILNDVLYLLPEAADLAQNRPLWRMMSTYGATQS